MYWRPPYSCKQTSQATTTSKKETGTQPHAHISSHSGANLDAFTHSLKVGPHAKVDANITSDSDFQRGLLQWWRSRKRSDWRSTPASHSESLGWTCTSDPELLTMASCGIDEDSGARWWWPETILVMISMVICGRDARHMLAGNLSRMFGKVSQCVATAAREWQR